MHIHYADKFIINKHGTVKVVSLCGKKHKVRRDQSIYDIYYTDDRLEVTCTDCHKQITLLGD